MLINVHSKAGPIQICSTFTAWYIHFMVIQDLVPTFAVFTISRMRLGHGSFRKTQIMAYSIFTTVASTVMLFNRYFEIAMGG